MPDVFFLPTERARSAIGCVTRTPLLQRRLPDAERSPRRLLFLPEPGPVRAGGALRGSTVVARLVMNAAAVTAEPNVTDYMYALLDRNGVELVAWHCHPGSELSQALTPHLHVSAALRPSSADGTTGLLPLDKRHLPTGVVPLAAFVRMLIEEFGVEPLARDWQARLAEA